MTTYMVNSAILKSGKEPKACAQGAAKMLAKGKIKGIEMKPVIAVKQKIE